MNCRRKRTWLKGTSCGWANHFRRFSQAAGFGEEEADRRIDAKPKRIEYASYPVWYFTNSVPQKRTDGIQALKWTVEKASHSVTVDMIYEKIIAQH
jgi:hypothetical protein